MKRKLLIGLCCLCLCSCSNKEKNKEKIIDYIKNHHSSEWSYENEKIIVDNENVTIKLYNVEHWTSCATLSNKFVNKLLEGDYSANGIEQITFECLDSNNDKNSYVVIEKLSDIENNFADKAIIMDKNKNAISQSLNDGLKEFEDNFKQQCESYTYREMFRNPENYKGKKVKITGEVIQVIDDDDYFQLRVNMTKNEYDYYEDTIFVQLEKAKFDGRVLEGDIISFYGINQGTITYQTVMGNETTIPAISAYYAELEN